MALIERTVIFVALQLFILHQVSTDVLTPDEGGVDVTKQAVELIQGSGIFADDFDFLIRLAAVESDCGNNADTYRAGYHGGIWQVDQNAFDITQEFSTYPDLAEKYFEIETLFGISWITLTWVDLRKPLYSVLAASLFLFTLEDPIPSDLESQAVFWRDFYTTGEEELDEFVDAASTIKGDPHITQRLDGSPMHFRYEFDGHDGDMFTIFSEPQRDIKINVKLTKIGKEKQGKYIGEIVILSESEKVYIDKKGVQFNNNLYKWKTVNDVPFGKVGHVHFNRKGVVFDVDGLMWLNVNKFNAPTKEHLDFVLNHIGKIGTRTGGIIGDMRKSASIIEKDKKLILTNVNGTKTSLDIKPQAGYWNLIKSRPKELWKIILRNMIDCLEC